MIGGKKKTSDVSSSGSRERELLPKSTNPLLLKARNAKESANRRKKSSNFSKGIEKRYVNKLDKDGKVKTMLKNRQNSESKLKLGDNKENIHINKIMK